MALYLPENLPPEAKKTIEDTLDNFKGKSKYSTDRGNFAAAVGEKQLETPFKEIIHNWDRQKPEELVKQVREKSEVLNAFINNMSPGDMNITLENLAKMEEFGHKYGELLTLDQNPETQEKYGWVENGLRYAMDLPITGIAEKDKDYAKVEDDIIKALLSKPDALEDPNFAYACTLLTFAKPEKRKVLVDKCLQTGGLKDKPEEQKKLLMTLCDRGAISPLEMEEALTTACGTKAQFTDQEMQEKGRNWEDKYNYLKRAKELSTESYMAKNAANEMFTLGNALRLFGYVAGTATVVLNGIANWKKIKEDPSYALRIPQVWFGAGEVALAAITGSETSFKELTASKETMTNWNEVKAREGLLSVVSASPRGWKKMLEDNKRFGVRTIAKFVSQHSKDGDFKENEITTKNFKKFLKDEESKNPGEEGYKNLSASLKKIEDSEQSSDTTEIRFKKLAFAFSKLNIMGDKSPEIYENNLAIAQGKTPTPKLDEK